jgi:phytoene dehydrogenase-like protein
MGEHSSHNAIVVGSGPNGLAASITLAEAGIPVTVYERNSMIGGACRSSELINPGDLHDIGSAIHPLAVVSPFFQKLPLQDHGLNWITPPAAVAHPLDDSTAVLIARSVSETASLLDNCDKESYQRLMTPMVYKWLEIVSEVMYFPRISTHTPRTLLSFSYRAMRSAVGLAESFFTGARARALIAGLGVHSVMSLERRASAAAGLVLAIAAHTTGWSMPEGGSQRITDALSSYLIKLGGNIITDNEVQSLDQLPPYEILMLDVTPHQFLNMAKQQLPDSYKRRLDNYKYGPGVFKLDWILDGPIPWKAKECLAAGTVHLGGSLEEIATAERSVWNNQQPEKPFVILAQPSLFDRARAKGSGHIVWAYSHVPKGSHFDMTGKIEAQIERFAPGFKERIIARHVMYPSDLEKDNPNCIGGDITGGAQSMRRLIFPEVSYHTPIANVFLCSASTPPGPGVHGICGERSASLALKKLNMIRQRAGN